MVLGLWRQGSGWIRGPLDSAKSPGLEEDWCLAYLLEFAPCRCWVKLLPVGRLNEDVSYRRLLWIGEQGIALLRDGQSSVSPSFGVGYFRNL